MAIGNLKHESRSLPAAPSPKRRRAPTAISSRIDSPAFRVMADRLLKLDLNPYQLKLNSNLLGQLASHFLDWIQRRQVEIDAQLKHIPHDVRQRWLKDRLSHDQRVPENQPLRFLCDFLFQFVQNHLDELQRLRLDNQAFRKSIGKVSTESDRRQIILHYCERLGATRKELKGDEKAFARWFDEEAVTDRFLKQVGQAELELTFAFDRLARIITRVFHVAGGWQQSDPDQDRKSERHASGNLKGIWQRLNIESRLQQALLYDGDDRVHVAAIRCLRIAIEQLPPELAQEIVSQETIIFVNRAGLECNSDVWIQCEALSIINHLSSDADNLMKYRLSHPQEGDDIFVRRHIWKIHQQRFNAGHSTDVEIHDGDDPSPFVRQKKSLVAFMSTHPASDQQWTELALQDPVPAVRAAALLAVLECRPSQSQVSVFLTTLCQSLENEQDPFVVRTGLHVATQFLETLQSNFNQNLSSEKNPSESDFYDTVESIYQRQLVPRIFDLQHGHKEVPVRRWAAQANECIWAMLDDQARELINTLQPRLFTIGNGKSRRFSKSLFNHLQPAKLGRIFGVLAQADFGYDIEEGWFSYRVTRGFCFGFRFWRLFFEFTNTATDKRQALRHTVGRISTATMRAPSQILGELSETKVPGEPLTIGDDGSWRPFIPLLDDFVSVLNLSWFGAKTVEFFTSQGVTRVTGPRTIRQRLRACYELSFRFAKYATLRNWDEDSFPASTYLESLKSFGFEIQFQPYTYPHTSIQQVLIEVPRQDGVETNATKTASDSKTDSGADFRADSEVDSQVDFEPGDSSSGAASASVSVKTDLPTNAVAVNDAVSLDPSISKFFAASFVALPLVGTSSLVIASYFDSFFESIWLLGKRFVDYFSAPFENSLEQLVVFAFAFLFFVIFKHFYSNYTFRKARRSIPLSIGGWGTRGKSGTERLKAALVGVMGHGLVSKTTGCEAMFIHGYAMGEPLEIPLFRPYDKATIWEHRNLITLGAKMNPSVFLWECMALNPGYVDVLQRQWTCDDIGTITNTYPDHEDIQGPAGHDVATTISGFVPLKSYLLSTEEIMRPYVLDSCRLAKTEFKGVGWLESGLITTDVMERFPYQEHPDNIALVATMAEKLGCHYEYSLKAQADFLVPDLGVLKTHPVSTIRTRKIEFTNGCSANERFGCMGNWKRLGFDTQDPWEDPATWVCGVVNNRADRVPRSKVFAKIIVEDVNADRFFLIGSNLQGLQSFIQEAWQEKAATISLCDQGKPWDREFALAALKQAAWDFRQPVQPNHIQSKLKWMLEGIKDKAESADKLDVDALANLWSNESELKRMLESVRVGPELIVAIIGHCQELVAGMNEYTAMRETIEDAPESIVETVEQKYREMLANWYQRKIVVIPNYDATGEDIVHRIVEEVPPGFHARVIGMQNIKGTGLDFVYRFQAWDVCHEACEAVQSRNPQIAERGVAVLSGMPAIGQLCQQQVARSIQVARSNSALQRADLQAQLDVLEERLDGEVAKHSSTASSDEGQDQGRSELNQWLLDSAEQFLDVNDSLRRRDNADVIYEDLAACRISRQRAVVELRKINKRQKGGWLTSYYDKKMGKT